jgi:hypothetical protein
MALDAMIDGLSQLVEREHPDVAQGLRDTWNPRNGTLDGRWVSELQQRIPSLLGRFSDLEKVKAYNEMADAEGLGRLDESSQDIDFWIHDAFINEVIGRLVETDAPNRVSGTE